MKPFQKQNLFCLLISLLFFVEIQIVLGLDQITRFWPQPNNISSQGNLIWKIDDAEKIYYKVINSKTHSQTVPSHVNELIEFYKDLIQKQKLSEANIQNETSKSGRNLQVYNNILNIEMEDWNLRYSEQEEYSLNMSIFNEWFITCKSYTGLTRALETYSQLFFYQNQTFQLINMPLIISQDKPAFQYRGIMIDTSRHFIPVQILLKNLDAMMYNKMNVFHWHITDDDSFPLEIEAYPDLANNSKFGENMTYSAQQVQEIIRYALKRGVQVVPEIDSPSHAFSWRSAEQLKEIIVRCGYPTAGQLDPTLNQTYEAVQKIFSQVNTQFISNYVHFGGDEASNLCWVQRPQILQFMRENNISSYQNLQNYYRKRQKSIWQNEIKSQKKVIYWINKVKGLFVEEGDVIEWWGSFEKINSLKGKTFNPLILAPENIVYLNLGFGYTNGKQSAPGQYSTWRSIYEKFNFTQIDPILLKQTLGAETCLWSEVNNPETTLNKIWIRTSALAERLWNPQANSSLLFNNSINLVTRLVGQQRRMNLRGINTIPVTDELCANDPPVCFTNH